MINITSQEIVNLAVKVLDDKKASDIVVLDVAKLTSLGDHFIIASANSTTQVRALANEVEKTLKEHGISPLHTEQKERGSSWILIDYGSVMIHVFQKETRAFYELERLWADADRQDIDAIIELLK